MASVNKVILIGNLGRDPEVRFSPDGSAVANLSVATTSSWKDKASGERKEETEWHRVVFYGRTAEVIRDYLKKGRSIYLEGRLKTRKWTDKEGQEKWTTEIVGETLQMLGNREGGGGEAGAGSGSGNEGAGESRSTQRQGASSNASQEAKLPTNRPQTTFDDLGDEDIPF